MEVFSDESISNSSLESSPCDSILEGFFDENDESPEAHEKLKRFMNVVLGKDQPLDEEDCDRLDAIGVQLSRLVVLLYRES